jgi:hypothetical protein
MLKSGGSILDANPGSDLDAIQHYALVDFFKHQATGLKGCRFWVKGRQPGGNQVRVDEPKGLRLCRQKIAGKCGFASSVWSCNDDYFFQIRVSEVKKAAYLPLRGRFYAVLTIVIKCIPWHWLRARSLKDIQHENWLMTSRATAKRDLQA